MLGYNIVKWFHIVSAIVFFATGLGTALRMWFSHRGGNVQAIAATAGRVVRIDWAITATSGLALALTGAALVWMAGFSPGAPWLVASYILSGIVLFCWTIATRLRMRLRDIATVAAKGGEALPERYYRYMRWWFQLSWPVLIALLVIFYLMVAQPGVGVIGGTGIPAL